MTKKLLQSFKNIRSYIFDIVDSEFLYQYKKKFIRINFDENIKSKFRFSIMKKKIEQNRNIHNFYTSKKSNSEKSIIQN